MSVALLLLVSAFFGAITIPVMYALRGGEFRGVDFWFYGNVMVSVALLLFLLPSGLPLASVLLANTCLIGGVVTLNIGLRRFFSLRVRWGTNLAILLGGSASIAVLHFIEAHVAYSILVVSGVISFLSGWMALVIWGMRPRDRVSIAYYFASGAGIWIAVWHALRCVVHISGADDSASFLDSSPWNLTFFAVNVASIPVFLLGMIMLRQDRLMSRMRKALNIDDLTGASSRTGFLAECDDEFAGIAKTNGIATILYLDIDRFKRVNEQFGRTNGDLALKQFAEVVGSHIRPGDRLGRMGGEEFAILLRDAGPQDAAVVATNICQAVRQSPLKIDGGRVGLTVSIGVVTARPGEAGTRVIARAEAAAQDAKLRGGDRFLAADFDLPPSMFAKQPSEDEIIAGRVERRA